MSRQRIEKADAELAADFALRCIRFRRLVAHNAIDSDYSAAKNYLYFIDPDLIELITSPSLPRWVAAFDIFGRSSGRTYSTAEALASYAARVHEPGSQGSVGESQAGSSTQVAAAVLAGEYIFGGSLPGQNGRPLLVSTEHLGEVYTVITKMQGRFAEAVGLADWGGLGPVEQIRRLKAQRAAGSMTTHTVATMITQLVIAALGEKDYFDFAALPRLRKLLRERPSRIMRADLIEPRFGLTPPPDRTLMARLRNKIRERKERYPDPVPTVSIEADALTVSQIIQFNANRREADPTVLMITRDEAVEQAYDDWYLDVGKPSGQPYALRRPGQYHPSINLKNMPGDQQRDSTVFYELKGAVDQIVASFSEQRDMADVWTPGPVSRREMQRTIAEAIRERRRNSDRYSEFAQSLRTLNEQSVDVEVLWNRLARLSVQARVDVLNAITDDISLFVDELRTEQHAISKMLGDTAQELLAKAEEFSIQALILRYLAWATLDDEGGGYVVRAPASYLSYAALDSPVQNVITALSSNRPAERLSSLRALIEKSWAIAGELERTVITGYVSLEFGAWAAAELALRKGRYAARGREAADLAFAHCVSKRFTLDRIKASEQIWEIERDLTEQILHERRTGAYRYRIRSELVSVLLSGFVVEVNLGGDRAQEALGRAVSELRALAIEFSDVSASHSYSVGLPRIEAEVLEQIRGNALCLYAWSVLGLVPSTVVEEMGALYAGAEAISGKQSSEPESARPDYSVSIYQEIIKARDELSAVAGRLKEEVQRIFDLDKALGAIFEVPFIDQLEYTLVRDRLDEFARQ